MKKFLTSFFLILILSGITYAQTAGQIQDEAYPNQTIVSDNSPYAQLWKQVLDARKSGNEILYNELCGQLKTQYPNKFEKVNSSINPFKVVKDGVQPPFVPTDWITGDVLIHAGNICPPTPGNPNPNDRTIKIEADTNGNQYAAFINGTRDTMFLYKSTNLGLNWGLITSVTVTGMLFHSFDMFITDSLNTFKLGFAVSVVTTTSNFDGNLYWATVKDDGSGFWTQQIQATPSGRGLISPAIISDGYLWSASSTYWYVAYQNVDASTGAGNQALLALSIDWGASWLVDTARNSYNDYELDVDYTYSADTIYVLLTNNLSSSNENLRLRYSALSNIGTGVSFKQFNPASTSSPEKAGCLTSKRIISDLVVTYTIVQSGNNNIAYSYGLNGYAWTTGVPLSNGTQSETRSKIECLESQGDYHVSLVSTASGYDTVVYYKSTNITSGFADRQVVNVTNNSSPSISPDVVGYKVSVSANGGGVIFAGASQAGLFYDGSEIITGLGKTSTGIPASFSLLQNYPNPFNPATVIEFNIPKNEFVTLKVYSISGELVKVLLSSNINAGSYKYSFDGTGLSSGIYFYQIQSGEFFETKKMILIK